MGVHGGHWMGVEGIGWVYMEGHWMGVHGRGAFDGCTSGHWMGVHGGHNLDGCASPTWGIGWVCVMGDIGWVIGCTWGALYE